MLMRVGLSLPEQVELHTYFGFDVGFDLFVFGYDLCVLGFDLFVFGFVFGFGLCVLGFDFDHEVEQLLHRQWVDLCLGLSLRHLLQSRRCLLCPCLHDIVNC